jgi:hypothetical protein
MRPAVLPSSGGLEHATAVGKMLIEVKAQLKHGERQVARPLRVLAPLIKDDLAATDVIRQ